MNTKQSLHDINRGDKELYFVNCLNELLFLVIQNMLLESIFELEHNIYFFTQLSGLKLAAS